MKTNKATQLLRFATALIFCVTTSIVHADVEAMTIAIGRGSDAPSGLSASYNVPAGKVLVLHSVQFNTINLNHSEGDPLYIQIYEKTSNSSTTIPTYVNAGPWSKYARQTFDPPIRLLAGSTIGSNTTYGWYLFKGFLVDSTDLFAQLDVDLINPRTNSNQLLAEAKVQSPRPHRLLVQSSEDLQNFELDPTATVTATATPAENTVAIQKDGAPQKFMRVMAVARPNP